MVDIRVVRVAMFKGLMAVLVGMRACRLACTLMRMLICTSTRMLVRVMLVMGMLVFMLKHFMLMRVAMLLGQVQPDTQRHQACRRQQLPAHRFSQKKH